ncbi:MAG: VIT1/CCC1 transporter family protein [Nanoarchaeota archaeon]
MMKKIAKNKDYNGAVVLGLNDALVELSGALVGLSFALAQSKVIATVGLITGFAAALSMAASEYLSAKEDNRKNPIKASAYTGMAYILAVIVLVIPYFILSNTYYATATMFALVVLIIAGFTKYDSKLHNERFGSKFIEMLSITIAVSVISFLFGMLVKKLV